MLAATLHAGELGSWHGTHTGWIAQYAPDAEVRGYLDGPIPGVTSISDLPGSLGRVLQHTLLRSKPGKRWPHLERWDLDAATADPDHHLNGYEPGWPNRQYEPTGQVIRGEHLEDLEPTRVG